MIRQSQIYKHSPHDQSLIYNHIRHDQSLIYTCSHNLHDQSLGPVVQSPISANPGLTLNKTYKVNPGLALIGL